MCGRWWLALCAAACGGSQGDFTAGRAVDLCNQDLPACNTVVGCQLTGQSYTQGTFPGAGKFLVQLSGPSTVEVHFYLARPVAAGTTTSITWYESGCTSSLQQTVPGMVFVGEAEAGSGEFVRSELLSAPGDHLISYQSDATTPYDVAVVIIPQQQ